MGAPFLFLVPIDTGTGAPGAGFTNTGGIAGVLPDGSVATEAPAQEVVTLRIWEGSSPVLLRRITDPATGSLLDVDEVLSITMRVFDLSGPDPRIPGHEIELHWEEVLYRDLIKTADWSIDGIGYNFRHQVWPYVLSTGGHITRIEYVFHVLSYDPVVQEYDVMRAWHIHARSRYGQ